MKLSVSNNKFSTYELSRLRHAAMSIADNIGFTAANSSAISSLSFLLRTYFEQLCRDSLNSAINSGRSEVGLEDVSHVFGMNSINITELHDYIQQVQSFAPANELPLFPVVESLTVPSYSELADNTLSNERKDAERETAGNDGAEVEEEGNRDQNNKQPLNTSNSRSNARTAIFQKIFPNFAGAFAPDLGFSVRKIELPTEGVSVDQQLINTLPHPSEFVQHIMFEFDRSVAHPMRTKPAITEEQKRLLKKKKKKEKREREKRVAEASPQPQETLKIPKLKIRIPIPLETSKTMAKPQTEITPTPTTMATPVATVTAVPQAVPTMTIAKTSKTERKTKTVTTSTAPTVEKTVATPTAAPLAMPTMQMETAKTPPPTLPVMKDKQQSPVVKTKAVTTSTFPRSMSAMQMVTAKTSKSVMKMQTATTPTVPTVAKIMTTPIAVPQSVPTISMTTAKTPPPTLLVMKDKQQSPAPIAVTSSGRSVKSSKRKFDKTETEKPMSAKGQIKQKAVAKISFAPKAPKTPRLSSIDRTNNSAEKVKAIAKAVEQIAAAHHFSATPSSETVAKGTMGTNDGEEEEEPIWICPTCSVAYVEGQEMVACDGCDRWYHWSCVGILIPPPEKSQWFCSECRRKRKKASQQQQTSA